MTVIETERLSLRQLSLEDAPFILTLVNQPSFLRYIGDKQVRNIEDAQQYLLNGPIASYKQNGFGLYLVQLKDGGASIGMCGLIKRAELPNVDIGFAFLPDFWGQGFGFEAATAVLKYGQETLQLDRIVAITSLDNEPSIKLLRRMGFILEEIINLGKDREQVKLFGKNLGSTR